MCVESLLTRHIYVYVLCVDIYIIHVCVHIYYICLCVVCCVCWCICICVCRESFDQTYTCVLVCVYMCVSRVLYYTCQLVCPCLSVDIAGDCVPNRRNEIHIDSNFTKSAVWKEYSLVMEDSQTAYLSESAFGSMWRDTMPQVKIRKHKNVDSKCQTCGDICLLRSKATTKEEREELTKLFRWHRMTFMAERNAYYERIRLAKVYLFPIFIPLLPIPHLSFYIRYTYLSSTYHPSILYRKIHSSIFLQLVTACNNNITTCHIWQTQAVSYTKPSTRCCRVYWYTAKI